MRTWMMVMMAMLVMAMSSQSVLAQGGPPDGPGGPGGPGGPPPQGPGGGAPGGQNDRGGQDRNRRPGPPPPPPHFDESYMNRMSPVLQMMRAYLSTVQEFVTLTKDPSATGVAASLKAKEILEKRGVDSAITYFKELLPSVKDAAVARAIHIHLSELYQTAGQDAKALEELRSLMVGSQ